MSKMFAMAVPILPEKMDQWRAFIKELTTTRYEQFKENRKRLGVRERTFLQETPMGNFVVVTLEGEDPASAFTSFGAGNDEFTKWFMSQVKEAHGVDLTAPPQGPLPELVVDSASLTESLVSN